MKKYLLLNFALLLTFQTLYSQSNPVVLKNGFNIQRLMTIRDGAIRMERDEINNQLYYILTSGEIYQVIQPTAGSPYDSLVSSVTQHGVQYVQGMTFHDSTWYVSGNNNSNTPLTYGIIVRGKLQPNGTRTWDTLMHTANYQTNGPFDHLFSGVVLSPAGDSIFICSGARGDHGEIQTRNGMYPGLRNVPLTTNIYGMPTNNPSTITLENDSVWLDTNGYVYARGIRNHFDMAFDMHGNLFGVENSGDRDHNEELNWIQRGKHYGFPWVMGNTENPQQYSWFDPAADSLINHNSRTWRLNSWNNDPTFPTPPPGIVFELPIPNYGPDCDKYRDSLDVVHDASDEGIPIYSFTAHRSPLGLVFDDQSVLGPLYRGDGFMFSWTPGYDSTGSPPPPDSTHIGPFDDPSQDMVHLDLTYDSVQGNFRMNVTRIISDFKNPVDAEIDSSKIYLIENGYTGTSGLFVIHLPVEELPCTPVLSINTLDPCLPDSNEVIIPAFGMLPDNISWYDTAGTLIQTDTALTQSDTLFNVPTGAYYAITMDGGACPADSLPFVIAEPMSMTVDSVKHTTCVGCSNGEIYFTLMNAVGPIVYSPNPTGLPAGSYNFCVTDGNGCTICDSVTILDDPLTAGNIDNDKMILLYPNPVNNTATFNIIKGEINTIRVFDSKGKELTPDIISKSAGVTLNTSRLEQGLYTVEIYSGAKRFYKRMMVVR